jgi:hypothetical protein
VCVSMFWNVSFICMRGVYHSNIVGVMVVEVEVIGDSWSMGEVGVWLCGLIELSSG